MACLTCFPAVTSIDTLNWHSIGPLHGHLLEQGSWWVLAAVNMFSKAQWQSRMWVFFLGGGSTVSVLREKINSVTVLY